jgi:protein gp37
VSTTSTAISWCDATWNPLRGCSRVSAGGEHCYAERQAGRFSGPGKSYEGLVRKTAQGWRWTGAVRLIAADLETPLRWQTPRRIFVNSMSDLFYESVSEDLIDAVLAVMALAPQHTFQVLTKRPSRMMASRTERWPPARAPSLTWSGTRLDLPAETPGADRHRQSLNAAERLLHGARGEQARGWTPDGVRAVTRTPGRCRTSGGAARWQIRPPRMHGFPGCCRRQRRCGL